MNKYIYSIIIFFFLIHLQAQNNLTSQKLDTVTIDLIIKQITFGNITGQPVRVIKLTPSQTAGIESLDDFLNLLSDIDVRSRGIQGVQSDVSIRGGNFDQVVILLNGVKVNDPQTGHHNLDLPVDISMIDRIEILQGASGQNYGVNAYSGAINIITKDAGKTQAHAVLKIGQFGYLKTAFDLAHQLGKIAVYNGFTYQRSTGYLTNDSINNTDFYNIKDFVQIKYNHPGCPVELQAGYHQKDFGANSFYTSKYPWQYEKTQGYFANLSTGSGKNIHWKVNLFYKLHFDEFQLFRESVYQYQNGFYIHEQDTAQYAPGIYYPGHNFHRTRQWGGQFQAQTYTKAGKSFFNIILRNEHILSNKLGKPLNNPVIINDRDAYTKADERTYLETHLNQSKKWSQLEAGIGLNLLYEKKIHWQINGSGYLSYRYQHWIHYINAGTSSRLPTFTDLYYEGPANTGNQDLKPETAVTYEAGTKFFNNQTQISANIFFRQSKNTIDWIKTDPADKWQPQNLTDLQTFGIEFNAMHHFKTGIFKTIGLSYAYLDMNKDITQNFISKYVLDYLKHKASISILHNFFFNSKIHWTAIYKNRNGQYLDYTGGQYRLFDYKPYWIANMKWSKQINRTRLAISIENIFDISFNDLSYIKMPGRWIIFEINYKIK